MKNFFRSSNSQKELDAQREVLLTKNYDLVYWVYEFLWEKDWSVNFDLVKNALICFDNQLWNLKWLSENWDISILSLNSLVKWELKTLNWPVFQTNKKIMPVSGWVIDLFSTWENVHIITSLRDAAAWVSQNQRTTIAWRCLWENLMESIEIEENEEAPFLWVMNNEYVLAVWNWNIEYLKKSIKYFLKEKYDPNNQDLKKIFERWFSGVKYEELEEILLDILKNNRFVQYKTKKLNSIPWLEKFSKKIKVWNYQDDLYCFYNDRLNTYECKVIKLFEWFPEWFKTLWKRPSRLFLESHNQYPRFSRINNFSNVNPSGAIKIIAEEIEKNATKITQYILTNKKWN